MSLFSSQTIFSLLFTLLIGVALYYYIRYKTRVLELTVREQAKVLQSIIMSMNNNNQNIMNIVQTRSQEEIVSDAVANDMNRFRQVNENNELIEVSDDSDSDSDSGSDNSSDSDSSSSSGGSESGSDDESEHGEEPVEDVANNGTRKIVFNGGNDCHTVEHLDGPDVKVIELTHPLYPKNENEVRNGDDDEDDEADDDEADDDEADDADEDENSDSESLPSDMDIQHDNHENHESHESHESHEIKENIVINDVTNQIQNHVESETISEVILEDNSLDNLSVKTVFKTKETKEAKEAETHSDYNSMNVQSLRQHLKTKLICEGTNMSEASINKLTKKELIKHLS